MGVKFTVRKDAVSCKAAGTGPPAPLNFQKNGGLWAEATKARAAAFLSWNEGWVSGAGQGRLLEAQCLQFPFIPRHPSRVFRPLRSGGGGEAPRSLLHRKPRTPAGAARAAFAVSSDE